MASVGAVFGVLLLGLMGLGLVGIPSLIDQAGRLAENAPRWIQSLRMHVDAWLTVHRQIGPYRLPPTFDAVVAPLSDRASAFVRSSSSGLA